MIRDGGNRKGLSLGLFVLTVLSFGLEQVCLHSSARLHSELVLPKLICNLDSLRLY